MMSRISIYLTNLGKYNEGELVGEWLELPATEEEIEACKKRIGISDEPDENGNIYEEYFVTDYECEFYAVGEYESLDDLNELAETLDGMDDDEAEIVEALMDELGYDLEEAIDAALDCIRYEGCDDMGDVAYRLYEDGCLGDIPERLVSYIDWDAYGRDLSFEGTFVSYNGGYIEVCR